MPKYAKSGCDQLRELFSYDPLTGCLTWKVDRLSYGGKAKAGASAGTLDKYGYLMVMTGGLVYPAHKLAWWLHYGEWPTLQVDHINMDPLDNRISNLRLATMTQQRANQKVRVDSKSGLKGVQQAPNGRWKARIRRYGIVYRLGTFDTPEAAHEAYAKAAERLFGEFARAA